MTVENLKKYGFKDNKEVIVDQSIEELPNNFEYREFKHSDANNLTFEQYTDLQLTHIERELRRLYSLCNTQFSKKHECKCSRKILETEEETQDVNIYPPMRTMHKINLISDDVECKDVKTFIDWLEKQKQLIETCSPNNECLHLFDQLIIQLKG